MAISEEEWEELETDQSMVTHLLSHLESEYPNAVSLDEIIRLMSASSPTSDSVGRTILSQVELLVYLGDVERRSETNADGIIRNLYYRWNDSS